MTDEADIVKIAARVHKLLQLAGRGATEAEAASAVAKAQELLAAYNISMATVEQLAGGSGKREDSAQRGGMYIHEREVYQAVAELNFCIYFNIRQREVQRPERRTPDGTLIRAAKIRWGFTHRIVGRVDNVAITRNMADYLLGAIERAVRERLGNENSQLFSSWAVSFRKGAAAVIVDKLRNRRFAQINAERKRAHEAAAHANGAAAGAASTSTALTLASLTKTESAANIDFLYGEGTSAKWAAERAEKAAASRRADEAWTAWCKANPEKAAKIEREERAKARRRTGPRYSAAPERGDPGGFAAGHKAGQTIGLDQQASNTKTSGLL